LRALATCLDPLLNGGFERIRSIHSRRIPQIASNLLSAPRQIAMELASVFSRMRARRVNALPLPPDN